jgi:hypothetical protein
MAPGRFAARGFGCHASGKLIFALFVFHFKFWQINLKWEIGNGGHGGPGWLHPMAPGTF